MGEQGPDNTRILVGQGDNRDICIAPGSNLEYPPIGRHTPKESLAQDGPCSMDQQCTQISIAPLTNAQQPRLPSTGVLAGD